MFTVGSFSYLIYDTIPLYLYHWGKPIIPRQEEDIVAKRCQSVSSISKNMTTNLIESTDNAQISLEVQKKTIESMSNPAYTLQSKSNSSAIEVDKLIDISSFIGSLLFTIGSICFFPSVNPVLGIYLYIIGSALIAVAEMKRAFDKDKSEKNNEKVIDRCSTKNDREKEDPEPDLYELKNSDLQRPSSFSSSDKEKVQVKNKNVELNYLPSDSNNNTVDKERMKSLERLEEEERLTQHFISLTQQSKGMTNTLGVWRIRKQSLSYFMHIALTIGAWSYFIGSFCFLFATSYSSSLFLAGSVTFIIGGGFFGITAVLEICSILLSRSESETTFITK